MSGSIDAFITKWIASGGSERANYVSFLNDLCDVIGVPHPDATREDDAVNDYDFARRVRFHIDAGKRVVTANGSLPHPLAR